jgi:hypothetical protein
MQRDERFELLTRKRTQPPRGGVHGLRRFQIVSHDEHRQVLLEWADHVDTLCAEAPPRQLA